MRARLKRQIGVCRDCQRLPPGGKLSAKQTDEGAGLEQLSVHRHLIRFAPLTDWFRYGMAKICVYVDSEEELLALDQKAREADVTTALILDAGFTEFHGQPTYTALAFEPLEAERADELTGGLPLY